LIASPGDYERLIQRFSVAVVFRIGMGKEVETRNEE
jgi:hypothetical protein